MKKLILPAAAMAAILTMSAAKQAADPVIMTVNGKDVCQSEFEYLYNKNNSQQTAPQSVDEYLDMFVVYKLKVAEAEAAGMDTTETFRREFETYCADLSRPYMRDTTVIDRLFDEAYERMATRRHVKHIMLGLGQTQAEDAANRQRLDSIRQAIVGGADFAEMARKYSADNSAVVNGGDLGYISGNTYPYPFEMAVWNTPVGQLSEVFEDKPYGYHIVYVEAEEPNPGTVTARHILKVTRNLPPMFGEIKKNAIDSLYTLLQNGADFAQLARENSDDKGSAVNGGMVGAFGPGEMVAPFERVAFSLADGEISEPFVTDYGYHIVQTLSHGPRKTLAEVKPRIAQMMMRDERATMPDKARMAQYREQFGINADQAVMAQVAETMNAAPTAAEAFAAAENLKLHVFKNSDYSLTVNQVINEIPENIRENSNNAYSEFSSTVEDLLNRHTTLKAREYLSATNTGYRNLINEYRDGILLFDISNDRVWSRAASDTTALENYFALHRDNYTWDRPRFKGYVVFATSDSIAAEAKSYIDANSVAPDSLVAKMREQFGRDIKVERVLSAQGDNAIISEIAFGGPKAEPVGKWSSWFPYSWAIINQPESALDVKGAVSADYQAELETQWVESLRAKYPVKYNNKAIKKLTENK